MLKNFNNNYNDTILLNTEDIKNNFMNSSALDFEVDTFMCSNKISKEQLKEKKNLTLYYKKDKIKIDIINIHSDIQWYTRYCITNIKNFR